MVTESNHVVAETPFQDQLCWTSKPFCLALDSSQNKAGPTRDAQAVLAERKEMKIWKTEVSDLNVQALWACAGRGLNLLGGHHMEQKNHFPTNGHPAVLRVT